MPGLANIPPDVRTVHLGEFTHEHAELIAAALEEHGIVWWSKVPGAITGIWQRGVELFVDKTKLEEARALADRISSGSGS